MGGMVDVGVVKELWSAVGVGIHAAREDLQDRRRDRQEAADLLDDEGLRRSMADYVERRELGKAEEPDDPGFLEAQLNDIRERVAHSR